jgi:hypothetical protein
MVKIKITHPVENHVSALQLAVGSFTGLVNGITGRKYSMTY